MNSLHHPGMTGSVDGVVWEIWVEMVVLLICSPSFGGSTLGGEVLDVGIDRSDGSNGGSGGCRGRGCLCVLDLLGTVVSLGFSQSLGGSAFICTVSFLATPETESFPHAASTISWREFPEMDRVYIHGIRVFGGVQVGGEGGER